VPLDQFFQELQEGFHLLLQRVLDDGLVVESHLKLLHLFVFFALFPLVRLFEGLGVGNHLLVLGLGSLELELLLYDVAKARLGYDKLVLQDVCVGLESWQLLGHDGLLL
jgi:hypothetical protein